MSFRELTKHTVSLNNWTLRYLKTNQNEKIKEEESSFGIIVGID